MTPGMGVYTIDDHFDDTNPLPTADDDELDEDPLQVNPTPESSCPG